MALEVNELGIRMRVRDGAGEPVQRKSASCGCDDEDGRPSQELVEACVRRVLQVLRAKRER